MIDIAKNINFCDMLRIKAELDGEVVYEGKADSFILPFMVALRWAFTGTNTGGKNLFALTTTDWNLEQNNKTINNVFMFDAGGGDWRVRCSITSHGLSTGNAIYIYNVNGITQANGYHIVTKIDNNTIELQGVTGTGSEVYNSNVSTASWKKATTVLTTTNGSESWMFGSPQIRVGVSTAPNTVNTQSLGEEIKNSSSSSLKRVLNAGTVTIETPDVGISTSKIDIIQSFTNPTSTAVPVNEVGLWTRLVEVTTSQRLFVMIARDVLPSTINVGAGKTLTITYTIVTDVPDANGGILIQFNEILYRQLAATNREAKDIFNQNIIKGQTFGNFKSASAGANVKLINQGVQGQYIGNQIGFSTSNVVNTNFRLQDDFGQDTAYHHGTGPNEVFIYGQNFGDLIIDDVNNKIYFDIERIFENISGSDLTINEVGFYCGFFDSSVDYFTTAHALFRHLVQPAVTFTNGTFLKVRYRVEITP